MRLVSVLTVLMLLGFAVPAAADDSKSDQALFDMTGGVEKGAVCGARKGPTANKAVPFTVHVVVTNNPGGTDGKVRVAYADGSAIEYFIKVGTSFSFSEAGGGTLNVNDIIKVTGTGGALLSGSMSILTEEHAKPHPALAPNFCETSSTP